MAGLFGTKQKMPEVQQTRMPTPTDPELQRRDIRKKFAARQGRRSTILSDLREMVGSTGTTLGAGT